MKIKSSKKYTTRFKKMAFSGQPDEEVLSVITTFDDKGNVIEEFKIDDDEGTNEKILYTYDDQNKLIRYEHLMENEGISEVFVYNRDEKGRINIDQKMYGEDPGEKIIYHYDNHDQPVRIERYDSDGETESVEEILYNDKNHLIEHRKNGPDNELLFKTTITYNEQFLPVEKHTYDIDGNVTGTTALTYNGNGKVTRVTEWNEDGKISSDITSVYDDHGNVTERKIRDFSSRTIRFSYDDRNNCISEEVYDENGNLTMRSTYEFDSNDYLINESGYYLDLARGGNHGNSQSRYEYEYW